MREIFERASVRASPWRGNTRIRHATVCELHRPGRGSHWRRGVICRGARLYWRSSTGKTNVLLPRPYGPPVRRPELREFDATAFEEKKRGDE